MNRAICSVCHKPILLCLGEFYIPDPSLLCVCEVPHFTITGKNVNASASCLLPESIPYQVPDVFYDAFTDKELQL